MRLESTRLPLDLFALLALVGFADLLVLFDASGPVRVVVGLPYVLFVPGYLLLFALFPERHVPEHPLRPGDPDSPMVEGHGLAPLERFALALGLSIAVVPLLGLALNFTPWGIRLAPIAIALTAFDVACALAGWSRWNRLPKEDRHVVPVELKAPPRPATRTEWALSVLLVVSILVAAGTLIWAVTTPRQGEEFTEFYVLGPGGKAEEYPTEVFVGENATVLVGIVNHEGEVVEFTVEVWLLNATRDANDTTTVHRLVLFSSFDVALPHVNPVVDPEKGYRKQWEEPFAFALPGAGLWKVVFLLHKERPPLPPGTLEGEDVAGDVPPERVEDAYRELHLWVTAR